MQLIPREVDKLRLAHVGFIAQKRLARGVRLNEVEAAALIANQLQEFIRDGNHNVSQLMSLGKKILGRRHVFPSVFHTLKDIQVEGTFPDGTYLVTVHRPVCTDDGDLTNAFYGSYLPIPSNEIFPMPADEEYDKANAPGALLVVKGSMEINRGRERSSLRVINTGDRPVQVGSHYHFIETNSCLRFNRWAAYGKRLNIAAGTAVRFEPGDTKTVSLVPISGRRVIDGGNDLAGGPVNLLDDFSRMDIMARVRSRGFKNDDFQSTSSPPPCEMTRETYASMFGPTTGDRIRLADTNLWVKVEQDFTVYGDECKFGGGKTLRDGMGQASRRLDRECLDVVLTNAVVIDYYGIFKADIGIKSGKIVGCGKAGNPDVMDGVDDNLVVGSNTDVIACEGKIVTAGGIDSHVHLICPQQAEEAICSGITTAMGGGAGPTTGTAATTCTVSSTTIRMMLHALDSFPLNYGITGKGNDSNPQGLNDQVYAGVCGLKLHEDWGSTPMAIDSCLKVCDEFDIQCMIHTDTLNESGFVEKTIEAFKNRTIHTYHTEGAGGGHAPDIITVVEHENVLPSSTNPTRPYTKNTLDEHLDMLMVCHHLSRNIPEDIAFAESRIRAETIAAEDVLHDIGAISMISSDSQAMGRCGEVILRTWKTAHKNKEQRGPLPEDEGTEADNFRVKRYIAKYTINPAITQGISEVVGSIAPGKLADLVIWSPASFGAKPDIIVKGGLIAYATMGDANASIPTIQPLISRPMFAPHVPSTCLTFVSQAALASGIGQKYGLKKNIHAVKGCRSIGKKDMKLNDTKPRMKVDPETYVVEADGVICTAAPSDQLPLTQQHFLW